MTASRFNVCLGPYLVYLARVQSNQGGLELKPESKPELEPELGAKVKARPRSRIEA